MHEDTGVDDDDEEEIINYGEEEEDEMEEKLMQMKAYGQHTYRTTGA